MSEPMSFFATYAGPHFAVELATAEAWATANLVIVTWDVDTGMPYRRGRKLPFYQCNMEHHDGRVESVCAVDLTADWKADPYRRVVEARLAAQMMTQEATKVNSRR